MLRNRYFKAFALLVLIACSLAREAHAQTRAEGDRAYTEARYKDAYDIFRKIILTKEKPNTDDIVASLPYAALSLQQLGRDDELNELLESAVKFHPENWRVLAAVATRYRDTQHYGYVVAGEFSRGYRRGEGRYVSAFDHDRVRALQLYTAAQKKISSGDSPYETAQLFYDTARALQYSEYGLDAWKLQHLTDIEHLPDYGDYQYGYGGTRGTPATPDGSPVFYRLPSSFEAARNDGERWRWMLAMVVEKNSTRRDEVQMDLAQFYRSQYGERTLQQGYNIFGSGDDNAIENQKGVFALHTLSDNETIARLATGVKRFPLPDEYNFISIFREIAAKKDSLYAQNALDALGEVFEDRRQYPKAEAVWREVIQRFGNGPQDVRKHRLDQIVGAWGQFEPLLTQPTDDKGAVVDFRFRNGKSVSLEAYEIDLQTLLKDVREYLQSNPRDLEWNELEVENIGMRIVSQGQDRYVGKKVASWNETLEPRPDHFDRRVSLKTPLKKAGAYLLTATIAGGNTARVIAWVSDTVLLKKNLEGESFYYVADAVTGKAVPGATIDLFGYRLEPIERTSVVTRLLRTANVVTESKRVTSDKNGQATVSIGSSPERYQWLATASTPDGRLAYLGFSSTWFQPRYDAEYNETKVFFITDRPVYRPGQTVKFKAWIARAQYDKDDDASFANQEIVLNVRDPKGDVFTTKNFKTDSYGGVNGEISIPADGALGVYGLSIESHGGNGTFRVEEYKKPEFEVKIDAPTDPVKLGETVRATITARYYFGAPVTKATVKYKVMRTGYDSRWYPLASWDWLFGSGYWWFAYDYNWFPGWRSWGCLRPIPWWWPTRSDPPELVQENEVQIGSEGKVEIAIDTTLAKELHNDIDHKYSITAEVIDQSRRTITGTGEVIVSREPFKVFAWVDRGFYRAGDPVQASLQARRLDGKPVSGKGTAKLFAISYGAGEKVEERSVEEWKLDTDGEGRAELQFTAAQAGQYRLSYTVTDSAGHAVEGGYVFTVTASDFDGKSFRFSDVEIVPNKKEYAPGEKVRLMVNANRADATVLLFLRPTNGTYLEPETIQLNGKSTVYEFEVTKKDMPNFFVEAVTVANGKVYTEARQIVVPPEKRVLNVAVTSSQSEYKPGEEAKFHLRLTDYDGKPFVGSTVLSVYDRALEYISGGSNVPEIKEFFWKWQRHHSPVDQSNLERGSYNLLKEKEIGLRPIGIFGSLAEEKLFGGRGDSARAYRQKGAVAGGADMEMASLDAMLPSSAPMLAKSEERVTEQAAEKKADAGSPNQTPVQPTIRKDLADTAFWVGALETNAKGEADVTFKMPENLTEWKVMTWALGRGTRVGQADTRVTTKKDLLLRLQTPRFLVERDEVVISVNVHNYLKHDKTVTARVEIGGEAVELQGTAEQKITVKQNGEERVDWRLKVLREGEATIRAFALSDEESDAMEMKIPVYVHGMLKTDSFSVMLRPNETKGGFQFTVPAERRVDQSELEIRYSPSLAAAMVDALPYLAAYPYGCTEQTLSRFLPAAITQRVLKRMGLNLKAIQEKRTNLNAQEIGNDRERAKGWKRFDANPVFDEQELASMVSAGVGRLAAMQLSDGGWGWFSGWGENASPHTTAYVVHGLQIAKQNGVPIQSNVLERGIGWLKNYQAAELQKIKNAPSQTEPWKPKADNLDAFVFMVLADENVVDREMLEFLFRDRGDLAVYARSMYALALLKIGEKEKAATVRTTIEQFLVQDDENQTAYLRLPESNSWWFWYGSEYEAQSYYLKLLARMDPKGPVAPRLVKYLLNNRKHATYWNSTRDTAIAIEALAEYLTASGEDKPEMKLGVFVDGKQVKEVSISAENLFTFDNRVVLSGEALRDGKHEVEFRKSGKGPLYANGYVTNFTLEDFITRAGLEVKVNREYYRLRRTEKTDLVQGAHGQAIEQQGEKYEREPLENLSTVKSGDLVEIELEIDSKNDYEYLVFEDMKAAGFEPVEVRSGYNGNDMGAYVEFRDNRVAFFVRALTRGKHSVSYRMRAEIPGNFSALPTRGYAMYAPELRGNSDEIKLIIEDSQ